MGRKYILNEETLKFITEFESKVPDGEVWSVRDLTMRFMSSLYYKKDFDSNTKPPNNSIWYALQRSGNWKMLRRGKYKKVGAPMHAESACVNQTVEGHTIFHREEYVEYLANNLYEIILLKNHITDSRLKAHHLSAKGLGDDLFYITEGYYRQKGLFRGKHSMSDYITGEAWKIKESGKTANELIFEHMVPKKLYISQITESYDNGTLTEELICNLLRKYYYVCTVTKTENNKLPASNMGNGWDNENPFYRYEQAGIRFFPNR